MNALLGRARTQVRAASSRAAQGSVVWSCSLVHQAVQLPGSLGHMKDIPEPHIASHTPPPPEPTLPPGPAPAPAPVVMTFVWCTSLQAYVDARSSPSASPVANDRFMSLNSSSARERNSLRRRSGECPPRT